MDITPSKETEVRLKNIWRCMIKRCMNPKHTRWHRYGGRGIQICKEWLSYHGFRSWAIQNGYGAALTIDRKDNDGNYCADNCRWSTRSQQQNNRHNSLRFQVGQVMLTPSEIARSIGIPAGTIYYRIYTFNLKTGDQFPSRLLEPRLQTRTKRAPRTKRAAPIYDTRTN